MGCIPIFKLEISKMSFQLGMSDGKMLAVVNAVGSFEDNHTTLNWGTSSRNTTLGPYFVLKCSPVYMYLHGYVYGMLIFNLQLS